MADRVAGFVTIDTRGAENLVEALATAPARLARAVRTGLRTYMKQFSGPSGAWQRARLRGRPGVFRRSGDLAKSFDSIDMSRGDDLAGIAAMGFTTSRYARAHEKGAVIVPRNERTVYVNRKAHQVTRRVHRAVGGRASQQNAVKFDVRSSTYTVKRKMLVWKDEQGKWHFAKKVTIPPRLEWFQSFARDEGGRANMLRRACLVALGRYQRGDVGRSGREPLGPGGPAPVPA